MKKIILFILFIPIWAFCSSQSFIHENFGDQFSVSSRSVDPNDIVEDGKLALVHFVINPNKQKVAVIKEFEKDRKGLLDFEKEKKAYDLLHSTYQGKLQPPKLIKSGSDQDAFYLVIELAEGVSLNQLLKNHQSYEALSAIQESAQLLKEFHTQYPQKTLHQSKIKREYFAKKLASFCEDLAIAPPSIGDWSLGPIHGDLHPGNVFYHKKNQRVTFIDFSTLSKEIDVAADFIAEDAMKYLISLQAIAKAYGYSDSFLISIEEAFFKGYGRETLSQDEIEFFKMYHLMDFYLVYRDEKNLTKYPRKIKKQFSSIANYCKKELKASSYSTIS